MKRLNRSNFPVTTYPERVIQFGEGNFLRAFVDWMIHKANQQGVYNSSVVVVQPISQGLVPVLNKQDGQFTLVSRGLVNGEKVVTTEVISSINRGLLATEQWDQVLACAEDPNIDVLVSNTTEAGIVYSPTDNLNDNPPESYPAKVCAYLYRRFQTFNGDASKGMLLLPVELIDRNGDQLKEIVVRLAKRWELSQEFVAWIETANIFANTLVDRIVTGYPGKNEAKSIADAEGYQDDLVNTSEVFHLWVIEAPEGTSARFPLHKAGVDIKWVEDMSQYRTRKVRILNGAHTSTVALAYLAGFDYVREAVEDDIIGGFLQSVIFDEIIPTVEMDETELIKFANQVIERFRNPFIQHRWLDISLNSISKFKARALPSLLSYLEKGELAPLLTLSLAGLISLYRGELLTDEGLVCERNNEQYIIRDDRHILEFFHQLWQSADNDYAAITKQVLAQESFWGINLAQYPQLTDLVTHYLELICSQGVTTTIKQALETTRSE